MFCSVPNPSFSFQLQQTFFKEMQGDAFSPYEDEFSLCLEINAAKFNCWPKMLWKPGLSLPRFELSLGISWNFTEETDCRKF